MTPLVLLFTHNETVALLAVALMVVLPPVHHLDVPDRGAAGVEHPVRLRDGVPVPRSPELGRLRLGDMSSRSCSPWTSLALCFFPVLGNLRPDLVSFLPSMRQYAGNWASALWAFAAGRRGEAQPASGQADHETRSTSCRRWVRPRRPRSRCSRRSAGGRCTARVGALLDADQPSCSDIDQATRCGRRSSPATAIIGFNFGDGHLHDAPLHRVDPAAVRLRAGRVRGGLDRVPADPQDRPRSTRSSTPPWESSSAAPGTSHDAIVEQPWLPNGPIPLNVT